MQYFASFQPFEVFSEFNGVPGTYIKSFLISDKVNLNKWQATHAANLSNLDTFLGRPGIHYINPENGKRDHTGAESFEKSLQIQELYRVANIISVGCDVATRECWEFSKINDDDISAKIKSGQIKFISPSIWPEENSIEQIEQTDGTVIDVVHAYKGLHYAFVDEPAYGDDAEIKAFCDGTTKQCQDEVARFDASINDVGPLTEHEIKIPDSSATINTSHNSNDSTKNQMATTEEELRKELEDAKAKLAELKDELEDSKKSKQAQDEEEKKEGRQAQDEEDEEKKALKARIEVLEKQPLVDKIITSMLSASVISPDLESKQRSQLMQASTTELSNIIEFNKPFETKLNSLTQNSSVPYYGSAAYDASLDEFDDEALLQEVSG